VRLRQRIPAMPSRPVLAVTVAALGAALTAGLVWYVSRRRRPVLS
jgi:hypothetical protein